MGGQICRMMHVKWWHLSKQVWPWSAFSCWTYIRGAIHSIRHTPADLKASSLQHSCAMVICVYSFINDEHCALWHLSCCCTVQEIGVFLCVPRNVLSEQWRIGRVELHIKWKLPVVTWIKKIKKGISSEICQNVRTGNKNKRGRISGICEAVLWRFHLSLCSCNPSV